MIDYGTLMHNAMRGLIRQVLDDVAENGLPGDHHFYITFDTRHPDVDIAEWMVEKFPSDMTVVMQHWFDNLDVQEAGFSVTLNFGDTPHALYIPYASILTFVDPSVEFGLRFEADEEDDLEGDLEDGAVHFPMPDEAPYVLDVHPHEDEEEPPKAPPAEVVSLDKFRK